MFQLYSQLVIKDVNVYIRSNNEKRKTNLSEDAKTVIHPRIFYFILVLLKSCVSTDFANCSCEYFWTKILYHRVPTLDTNYMII